MNDEPQAVLDLVFGRDYQWWHMHNHTSVKAAAARLLAHGMSIASAADIINTVSKAIDDEFGE